MERRRVYGQACGFCAKRKIKCNGVYPCDNCAKRGRGDSCTAQRPKAASGGDGEGYQAPNDAERRDDIPTNRAHCDGSHRQHDVPPAADAAGQGATQDQSSRNPDYSDPTSTCSPSQLGANSMPSFINAAARSRHTHFTQSIRPALGLENAATSCPFMAGNQASGTEESHFNVASSHAEVLKYIQAYQTIVSPLFPFVPRHEDLEALILTSLERCTEYATSSLGPDHASHSLANQGGTSLMCAILACGAQMSDQAPDQRIKKSRQFANSAFHFARMANFLLRPQLSTVQAMLLLSFFLQNDGQADAAWSLLGTVYRLAMSMGLHRPLSRETMGNAEGEDQTWAMIKWQDCILSVCFDRDALSSSYRRFAKVGDVMAKSRTYQESMGGLVDLTCLWLAESEISRCSVENICGYIRHLKVFDADDSMMKQARSIQPSLRALAELLTLRLYCGYLCGVICRPALKSMDGSGQASQVDEVLLSVKTSTEGTMRAFIDLCKFTQLPLRSWSMIHAGLSAAITVEFIETPLGIPETSSLRQVQTTFLDLLSHEQHMNQSEGSFHHQAWLSSSHSSYLRALQDLLKQRKDGIPCTADNSRGDELGECITVRQENDRNDEMYTQARSNIASIIDAGQNTQELSEFDWSLNFFSENPLVDSDFNVPYLGF